MPPPTLSSNGAQLVPAAARPAAAVATAASNLSTPAIQLPRATGRQEPVMVSLDPAIQQTPTLLILTMGPQLLVVPLLAEPVGLLVPAVYPIKTNTRLVLTMALWAAAVLSIRVDRTWVDLVATPAAMVKILEAMVKILEAMVKIPEDMAAA